MPDTIKLVTPDYVELEFQLAGLGTRFTAVLIDHLFQFIALFVIALFLSFANAPDLFDPAVSLVVMLISIFLLVFGYFILFEWLWNGQTPGKRMGGLRVMRDDGRPIDFGSSAIRNIVRIADFLPGFYGAGVLAIFFNKSLKRLGDLAAGTVVVVERRVTSPSAEQPRATSLETGPRFQRFGKADRDAAVRFLDRRAELATPIRMDLASKIALAIAERAGVPPDDVASNPEAFLEYVARAE